MNLSWFDGLFIAVLVVALEQLFQAIAEALKRWREGCNPREGSEPGGGVSFPGGFILSGLEQTEDGPMIRLIFGDGTQLHLRQDGTLVAAFCQGKPVQLKHDCPPTKTATNLVKGLFGDQAKIEPAPPTDDPKPTLGPPPP